MIPRNLPRFRRIRRQWREANFIKLQPVQTPVVISTRADGLRQHDARSVYSLKNIQRVTPTCDLLDEDWCKPFRTKLLVDAEEIDLGALDNL